MATVCPILFGVCPILSQLRDVHPIHGLGKMMENHEKSVGNVSKVYIPRRGFDDFTLRPPLWMGIPIWTQMAKTKIQERLNIQNHAAV